MYAAPTAPLAVTVPIARRALPVPCPARRAAPRRAPMPDLRQIRARSAPHALLLVLASIAVQKRVSERSVVAAALRVDPARFGHRQDLARPDGVRVRRALARLLRYGLARRDAARRWSVTRRVRRALARLRGGGVDDVLAGRFGRYARRRGAGPRVRRARSSSPGASPMNASP